MKFADFKCNDCGNISEYLLKEGKNEIKCEKCGSSRLSRIFSVAGFKRSSSGDSFSSNVSSKSCSSSCSTCGKSCR